MRRHRTRTCTTGRPVWRPSTSSGERPRRDDPTGRSYYAAAHRRVISRTRPRSRRGAASGAAPRSLAVVLGWLPSEPDSASFTAGIGRVQRGRDRTSSGRSRSTGAPTGSHGLPTVPLSRSRVSSHDRAVLVGTEPARTSRGTLSARLRATATGASAGITRTSRAGSVIGRDCDRDVHSLHAGVITYTSHARPSGPAGRVRRRGGNPDELIRDGDGCSPSHS